MPLAAFDTDAIRYAFLKDVVALGSFEDHDCGCEHCEYQCCPWCEERINVLDLGPPSEKYVSEEYKIRTCHDCGHDAVREMAYMRYYREELRELTVKLTLNGQL